MIRKILSKIKGFCRPKKAKRQKNVKNLLHAIDLEMHEKAMELDEKRKQDYIQ